MHIGEVIRQHTFFPKTDWEKRQEALSAIHALYTSELEKRLRHRANKVLYIEWAKRFGFTRSAIINDRSVWDKFMATAGMKEQPIRAIAVRLSHLRTSRDMYYVLSICRDKHARGESIGAYIFGATKPKPEE